MYIIRLVRRSGVAGRGAARSARARAARARCRPRRPTRSASRSP